MVCKKTIVGLVWPWKYLIKAQSAFTRTAKHRRSNLRSENSVALFSVISSSMIETYVMNMQSYFTVTQWKTSNRCTETYQIWHCCGSVNTQISSWVIEQKQSWIHIILWHVVKWSNHNYVPTRVRTYRTLVINTFNELIIYCSSKCLYTGLRRIHAPKQVMQYTIIWMSLIKHVHYTKGMSIRGGIKKF